MKYHDLQPIKRSYIDTTAKRVLGHVAVPLHLYVTPI